MECLNYNIGNAEKLELRNKIQGQFQLQFYSFLRSSLFHIANKTESSTGIFLLWFCFSLNPSVPIHVFISHMLCVLYMSSSAMHSDYFLVLHPCVCSAIP